MLRIIFLTYCVAGWAFAADDLDALSPSSASEEHRLSALDTGGLVQLEPERQNLAGITVAPAIQTSENHEFVATGLVLDVQSLLDLRTRHREAKANLDVQSANLSLSLKNRDRILHLVNEDVLARRELVQAEMQLRADQAREEAARLQEANIHRAARYHWGQALANLALQEDMTVLETYLQHRLLLIQITLPKDKKIVSPKDVIHLGIRHDRSDSAPAQLISPAPRTDELIQGESWFASIASETLRPGMRIHAWIPEESLYEGLEVPSGAVLWHAGQAWVYVQKTPEDFQRIKVDVISKKDRQRTIISGLKAETPIVVVGGQTLLSEEFKARIPSEDPDRHE